MWEVHLPSSSTSARPIGRGFAPSHATASPHGHRPALTTCPSGYGGGAGHRRYRVHQGGNGACLDDHGNHNTSSSSPKPHRRQPRRPDTSHHCHAAQMPCSSERSQRCIFTGSRTVYGPASNGSSGAQAHAGSRPYAGMQALWCVTSPCGTHRHDHDRRRCVLFSFGSSSFGRPEYITRRSGGERSETRAGSEHARHDATTGWGAPCRLIATAAVAATPPPGRRHSHKTCT